MISNVPNWMRDLSDFYPPQYLVKFIQDVEALSYYFLPTTRRVAMLCHLQDVIICPHPTKPSSQLPSLDKHTFVDAIATLRAYKQWCNDFEFTSIEPDIWIHIDPEVIATSKEQRWRITYFDLLIQYFHIAIQYIDNVAPLSLEIAFIEVVELQTALDALKEDMRLSNWLVVNDLKFDWDHIVRRIASAKSFWRSMGLHTTIVPLSPSRWQYSTTGEVVTYD